MGTEVSVAGAETAGVGGGKLCAGDASICMDILAIEAIATGAAAGVAGHSGDMEGAEAGLVSTAEGRIARACWSSLFPFSVLFHFLFSGFTTASARHMLQDPWKGDADTSFPVLVP